jgi:pimeloyl-ACP methyl ester carboxylesterase
MIWKTSRDSARVPTKDGSLAVRVDGDPHKDPLLLCQRFRGTMDDWDPEFVARLSTVRRVIRFDNLGIGESSGETPNTVRGMAEVVPLLLDALGIDAVDLLGWSLGGYVGQTVALTWPERVRHLVIAGSGPGGPDGPPPHPRVAEIAAKTTATREDVQFLFFTGTESGTAAARRHFDSARPLRRNPVADSARRSCHGGRGMERHGRISASSACRS